MFNGNPGQRPLNHAEPAPSTGGHGDLALDGQIRSDRTGLAVLTLHHYDEIGLLKPSRYSEAGYRLYTVADVAHLRQVLSPRQLGFALEVIRLHIARLREPFELQPQL